MRIITNDQPKRCETGIVHPWAGECYYCGAANGEVCRMKKDTKSE